jgi:hypothetical protein
LRPVIASAAKQSRPAKTVPKLDCRVASLNGVVPIRVSELMETPSAKFSEIFDFVKTTALAMTIVGADDDDCLVCNNPRVKRNNSQEPPV